ncbi:hypothetical protein R3P38DRAFT_2487190, partial [Favolaschia claudopus]
LDNIATLRLTTGLRQIERIELYIFPLLYQILLRHLDIMQLACVHNLHESEFDTMSTSLYSIFSAVEQRTARLAVIYKSNALDVKEGLSLFAFGMFQLFFGQHEHDPINYTLCTFQEEHDFVPEDLEELGPQNRDKESTAKAILEKVTPNILLNGILVEPELEHEAVLETKYLPQVTGVEPYTGMWTGQLTSLDGSAHEGKLSLVLIQKGDNLFGAAENYLAVMDVSGTIKNENCLTFTIMWPEGFAVVCEGKYNVETNMITGFWSLNLRDIMPSDLESALVETSPPTFAMTEQDSTTRTTPDLDEPNTPFLNPEDNWQDAGWVDGLIPLDSLSFEFRRPVLEDETRLTTHALSARERFIELRKRQILAWRFATLGKPWTKEEAMELLQLQSELLPSYSRLYNTVSQREIRQLVIHHRSCSSCHYSICGTRFFCIECMNDLCSEWVDLCMNCKEHTPQVIYYGFNHLRSHLLVKTTRHVHDGELRHIVSEARRITEQIKVPFKVPPLIVAASTHGEDLAQLECTPEKIQSQEGTCNHCKQAATYPFWVCIDCTWKTYVCTECEANDEFAKWDGVNTEHRYHHLLVLIFDNPPLPEVQIKDVTLQELKSQISALESRLVSLEVKLDGQFALLQALL